VDTIIGNILIIEIFQYPMSLSFQYCRKLTSPIH
jgi:hypothetical protein